MTILGLLLILATVALLLVLVHFVSTKRGPNPNQTSEADS
jgi:hypothetical protein